MVDSFVVLFSISLTSTLPIVSLDATVLVSKGSATGLSTSIWGYRF